MILCINFNVHGDGIMEITNKDKPSDFMQNKAKLGKLIFYLCGPTLILFILIQALLYIVVNWQINAPLGFFALPLFILALALNVINIIFIYLLILPQCSRQNIDFGYYSLNLTLGPLITSIFAISYYVITGNMVFTLPLNIIAISYTVWFYITYGNRFLKL